MRARALDVQQVLDAFRQAGSRVNIVVLDACRNNPFAANARTKGLAPMDAPPAPSWRFATAPGRLALERRSAKRQWAVRALLIAQLQGERLKIEDVFKRVRLQVRKASGGSQIPWESTSLETTCTWTARPRPPRPTRSRSWRGKQGIVRRGRAVGERPRRPAMPRTISAS